MKNVEPKRWLLAASKSSFRHQEKNPISALFLAALHYFNLQLNWCELHFVMNLNETQPFTCIMKQWILTIFPCSTFFSRFLKSKISFFATTACSCSLILLCTTFVPLCWKRLQKIGEKFFFSFLLIEINENCVWTFKWIKPSWFSFFRASHMLKRKRCWVH